MSDTIKYEGFVQRSYFSRYSKDRTINDGEDLYLEYDSKIDFSQLKGIYHEVSDKDRSLMTLARYYYSNPLYWWIIAQANNIIDPYEMPSVGTYIRIPYRDEVIRVYNSLPIN